MTTPLRPRTSPAPTHPLPLLLPYLLLLLSLVPLISCQVSTPVIAYWSFNADFASPNSHPAYSPLLSNSPQPISLPAIISSPCPFPPCASFSQPNPYPQTLSIAPNLTFLGVPGGTPLNWSVAVWIAPEPEPNTAWQGILGAWGNDFRLWSLRICGNQVVLIWGWQDGQGNPQEQQFWSVGLLPYGYFSHIALTYANTGGGNGTMHLYINGTNTDTWAMHNYYAVRPVGADVNWEIGGIQDANFGYLGLMDELFVFSVPLTPVSVQLLIHINSIGSCAPGYYGYGGGFATCAPCPSGYFSAALGAITCNVCPVGTYSNPGSSICQACPAGTYAASTNTVNCTVCDAGMACPSPGLNAPIPCVAGQYSTGGAVSCSYCPSGYLSPPGAMSASACTACHSSPSSGGVVSGGGIVPVCCAGVLALVACCWRRRIRRCQCSRRRTHVFWTW